MDVTSYLLGKNASGGGGGQQTEYFREELEAGNSTNPSIMKLIKTIPKNTKVNITNLNYAFKYSGIETVPLLDTKNVTTINNMFSDCDKLISVPLFNFSNVTSANGLFEYCTSLVDVPKFDFGKCTNFSGAFRNCRSLSNESLDNILQICIGASAYIGAKTLNAVGISTSLHPKSKIEALPHYQDFLDAGWTIS